MTKVHNAFYRKRVPFDCGDQVRTKQQFKDDCDVNLIVKRHASTGMWSHLSPRNPTYEDVSGSLELQEALELVSDSLEAFGELPARVRALCNNDPVSFLAAMADPASVLQLAEAGLPMAEGWKPPETDEKPLPPSLVASPTPQKPGEEPPAAAE